MTKIELFKFLFQNSSKFKKIWFSLKYQLLSIFKIVGIVQLWHIGLTMNILSQVLNFLIQQG